MMHHNEPNDEFDFAFPDVHDPHVLPHLEPMERERIPFPELLQRPSSLLPPTVTAPGVTAGSVAREIVLSNKGNRWRPNAPPLLPVRLPIAATALATPAAPQAATEATPAAELVEEDPAPRRWQPKIRRMARWRAEETETFYTALQQLGADFSGIAVLLPGRDRNEIKAKFKMEQRLNADRIDHLIASVNKLPLDVELFTKNLNRRMEEAGKKVALSAEETMFLEEIGQQRNDTDDIPIAHLFGPGQLGGPTPHATPAAAPAAAPPLPDQPTHTAPPPAPKPARPRKEKRDEAVDDPSNRSRKRKTDGTQPQDMMLSPTLIPTEPQLLDDFVFEAFDFDFDMIGSEL